MFIINLLSRSFTASPRTEEMSVMDHLEEFRWRMIRVLLVTLVFTIIAFMYMPFIFQNIIFAPAHSDFWTYRMLCSLGRDLCIDKVEFTLQSRTMSGQFSTHIMAALIGGLICSFPYIAYEIWMFVKPALHLKERNMSFNTILFMPVLFASGIMFGYYIIAPMSINFLANYTLDPSIVNQFDITSYMSTLCMLVLGSGLMFQLPILIYFLSIVGIVTPEGMSKYRKHSIIGIFVLAALITPSPDMLTQTLVAIPLYILYEISIWISASVHRRKAKSLV